MQVFRLQVGEFFEDLFGRQTFCEQFQYVRHPDTHSANTGPASALLRIDCDALGKVMHILCILFSKRRNADELL
jgi:hypothetical protein